MCSALELCYADIEKQNELGLELVSKNVKASIRDVLMTVPPQFQKVRTVVLNRHLNFVSPLHLNPAEYPTVDQPSDKFPDPGPFTPRIESFVSFQFLTLPKAS